MACSVRSEADSGVGDSLGVCPAPASIVNGDILSLIAIYFNDNPSTTPGTVTCTPPAGFTSVRKTTFNFTGGGAVANQQINLEVFRKVAASESGSYTSTLSNNDAGAAAYSNFMMLAIAGADTSTPVGTTSTNTGGPSASSSTSTGTGVTVGRAGSLLLWVFAGLSKDSSFPAGFTAVATDVDGVQGIASLAVNAGATGNETGTVPADATTQNGWIVDLLVFQPISTITTTWVPFSQCTARR